MRRSSLVSALFAMASVAPFGWGEPSSGTDVPVPKKRAKSVLFYLIDTCRGDRLGFDGYDRETSPFLDEIASRSVVFERCYSQAPWTKPSMASMLTSRYPSSTGVFRMYDRLPGELQTWPEVLASNGMYTAGFSANIVMGNALSNFAQGFQHFVESTAINRGDPIRFASGSAKKLNEHAFAWLDETDHWPMLLYLHSVDPHEEYEPESRYLEQFADPERHPQYRDEWQKLLDSRPPIPGLYVTQDNFDRTGVDATSFIQHGRNLYDADILANDDQLRRLFTKLDEDGWGEDFIFVLTSDHGEEFFEHGGTSHGYSLYDEMVRVPLMIYAPGLVPEGMRIESPVRCLDIYPTLCELLGFDVPEGLAGHSLVPLIRGDEPAGVRPVFAEHREDPVVRSLGHGSGVMVSLLSGRFKFILNHTSSQLIERPRFELYDLVADPGETKNVAEEHPEFVKALERRVARFVAAHRRGAAVEEWVTHDPEVLAELRALCYLGDDDEEAPDLWEAVQAGDLKAVQASLKAGADPNEKDPVFGATPLSKAATYGELRLAKLLIAGGAKVDARDKDGATPLIGAAFFGRHELVELLLAKGADRTAKNATSDTALSVTQAPWGITQYVADLLQLKVDRATLEAGRKKCVELLERDDAR